eukprot:TRINITY_DN4235_c0_g1_i1.p1 TRINITY_DN4235_c0_g1~~TRINITY_DN4235_c0_g1_i1.p1  ORF type:complete len:446 (+),score=95.70 TRINITY_DN4235_c0_g1_i1:49-1386(+)
MVSKAYSIPKSGRKGLVKDVGTPGPGFYQPKTTRPRSPQWKITGGHKPLLNNMETPSPGKYHRETRTTGPRVLVNSRNSPPLKNEVPGPGTYSPSRQNGGPSYSLYDKNFFAPRSETPGPGTYIHYRTFDHPLRRNHSGSKSPRKSPFEPVERNPGPGAYEGDRRSLSPSHKISPTEERYYLARDLSRSFFEPGPGYYNPKPDEAQKYQPSPKGWTIPPESQLRGLKTEPVNPGPADYQVSYTGVQASPRSQKMSPSPRNVEDREALSRPGPGYYEPKTPERRSPVASMTRIERLSPPRDDRPGPGTYNTPPKAIPSGPEYSFGFRREDLIEKYRRELPGPGFYDDGSKKNLLFVRPRSPNASMNFEGHNSRAWLYQSEIKDNPGPGGYYLKTDRSKPEWSFSKIPRDLNNKNDIPGPGTYEIKSSFAELPSYVHISPKAVNQYP